MPTHAFIVLSGETTGNFMGTTGPLITRVCVCGVLSPADAISFLARADDTVEHNAELVVSARLASWWAGVH